MIKLSVGAEAQRKCTMNFLESPYEGRNHPTETCPVYFLKYTHNNCEVNVFSVGSSPPLSMNAVWC